jgi:hypothetical protein
MVATNTLPSHKELLLYKEAAHGMAVKSLLQLLHVIA